MEECIYKEYNICAKKHCCPKADVLAEIGEGWRDARKESPNKTGIYVTFTYPSTYEGEIYNCELYSEKHGGWCEAENNIDLWLPLPDPPAFA